MGFCQRKDKHGYELVSKVFHDYSQHNEKEKANRQLGMLQVRFPEYKPLLIKAKELI